jgi:hypothetical protein
VRERPVWQQPPNAFSVLVIVLLGANYFAPFSDLDFAWQIRTGERIVETGRFRPPEAFTYTINGRQVPEFEWLYEVILWAVWKVFGFGGLKLLKTALVVAPLLLLSLRLRKERVPWHGIFLALLGAVVVLSPAWNLRPLFCTTVGLLLVSGWLHDHCQGRQPLTRWLPLLMLLWSNLHPGVAIGQGLLAGAILWEWLNRCWQVNPPLEQAACWRLTWIGGLGLAATFLSPDAPERLVYPFRQELRHPIQRIFVEMQPLYTFLGKPPYTTGLVYLVAVLVGLTVVLRFRHYRLWEVALLGGLVGLANLAVRSLQDWLLVMLALGVPHLTILLRQLAEKKRAWKHAAVDSPTRSFTINLSGTLIRLDRSCKRMLNGGFLRMQWFWPSVALGLLTGISLYPPLARHVPIQESPEWPGPALDWISAASLQGRFFAPPDYGSYLTWRLGDRAKCYVDTRGFFFPGELIEDSHYVPQLGPQWQARLERVFEYGTDYFLLETTGPRGQFWQFLQPHVHQPLYCDERTVLLSAMQVRQALAYNTRDGLPEPSRPSLCLPRNATQ